MSAAHTWDEATRYCTRCGVQQGYHAEECLATANCTGFMHHLVKRQWERRGVIVERPQPILPSPSELARLGEWFEQAEGNVERFPPPESA